MRKLKKVKVQIGYFVTTKHNGRKPKKKKFNIKLFTEHFNEEDREKILKHEREFLGRTYDLFFISMYWKDNNKSYFIDLR